jgi:hypothetical protein
MKAINAIYKHRHLYNLDTGKRIILDENSLVSITVMEDSLLKDDPYNPPDKILRSREQLIAEIEKEHKYFKLFREKDSKLWFRVNAGERVKKNKASRILSEIEEQELFINNRDAYLFEIDLQEDLFWVCNDLDFNNSAVYKCACTVVKECYNHLRFFEPIYAPTLNQAYSRTYEFYFPLYGSATTSIYNTIIVSDKRGDFLRNHRNNISF